MSHGHNQRLCWVAHAAWLACVGAAHPATAGAPVRVLVYTDILTRDDAAVAALELGWQVQTAGPENFNQFLTTQSWDVIAVDAPLGVPLTNGAPDWYPLTDAILCGGVRAVISVANFSETAVGSLLNAACECAGNGSITQEPAIHIWPPLSPVLAGPHTVSLPMSQFADLYPDAGDQLATRGNGVAIASYSNLPSNGDAAIVIGREGRTIVNGALLANFGDAANVRAIWKNELLAVWAAPPAAACPPAAPLEVWTVNGGQPMLTLPSALGLSWGDFDTNGWPDLMSCSAPRLWRNNGGDSFTDVAEFQGVLDPLRRRYGASFGDFNTDGLPDLACEPRADGAGNPDDCLRVLVNNGGGFFADVSTSLLQPVQPCDVDGETNCWGDVDGDGDLDLFVPAYPAWVGGGPGNLFYRNRGIEAGPFQLQEMSATAGLTNPLDTTKPEGAQFCDYDMDGDIDLYSNTVLYRNISTFGMPAFEAMAEEAAGMTGRGLIDEGAAFFDYDMDGDDDLMVAYVSAPPGVVIYENRGDGTFTVIQDRIEQPEAGLTLGLSYADWDSDGDIDLVTRDLFRRNMLCETGSPYYAIQRTNRLTGLGPQPILAWCDIDRDGDMDAAVGSSLGPGSVCRNTTYDAATPPAAKRHVRIRAIRRPDGVPFELETEYGAAVQLRIVGPGDDGRIRRGFVASGHGYLNQNEYGLTFALPPDPFPDDPARDVRFSVEVTFPQTAASGMQRIDHRVNPLLGGIDLATLSDREIRVARDGSARINGQYQLPLPNVCAVMNTASGGLAACPVAAPLPDPTSAPQNGYFVGLEVSNVSIDPISIEEVIVDGVLSEALACEPESEFNITARDVTDPQSTTTIPGGLIAAPVRERNRRSYVPCNWLMVPGQTLRIVARVQSYRATSFNGPLAEGGLFIAGGLRGAAQNGCDIAAETAAPIEPGALYLTVRYSSRVPDRDCNSNLEMDELEIAQGSVTDCNHDYIPDSCQVASCPGILPGDFTCDGRTDGRDIRSFVYAVVDHVYSCHADMDQNGNLEIVDVDAFVARLLND